MVQRQTQARNPLSRGLKGLKNTSAGCVLRHFVGSWDTFAPLTHLHGREASCTMPPDHAELCSQKIPENAEANGACQALLGMIWDSACPRKKGQSSLRPPEHFPIGISTAPSGSGCPRV